MDFTYPDTTQAMADSLKKWGGQLPTETIDDIRGHANDLNDLGFFSLATPDGPDPENAQLNSVIALEALAAAGVIGPLSETLFAHASGAHPEGVAPTWAAGGSRLVRDGKTLVPYGAFAESILTTDGSSVNLRAAEGVSAHVIMQNNHTWEDEVVPFEEIAVDVAWRNNAALVVGYSSRLLELARLQVEDRVAFNKKLITFQAPRFKLVEIFWRIEGLRNVVIDAAWRADNDDPRSRAMSALAWIYASQVSRIVARHTVQVMGAMGFQDEAGVPRLVGAMATLRLSARGPMAATAAWSSFDRFSDFPSSNVLGALNGGGASAVLRQANK